MAIAWQALLTMGFPRQEYWSGLPFPSQVYLSNPGIKPTSPALQVDSLPLRHHWLINFSKCKGRVDSLEKTLMLGGIGGKRRRGWQRMRWLDDITYSMDVSLWTPGIGDGQGGLACCNSWGHKESDTTVLLNWTELNHIYTQCYSEEKLDIKSMYTLYNIHTISL